MDIYRNMCLSGLVKIRWIVLEISCRKWVLWSISASYDLDLWPPDLQTWTFHARPCPAHHLFNFIFTLCAFYQF